MKRILTISLWALIVMAMPIHAAQSYVCDFENEADRNRWVLNPVATSDTYAKLTNKWYMDELGNNGKNGQYVCRNWRNIVKDLHYYLTESPSVPLGITVTVPNDLIKFMNNE